MIENVHCGTKLYSQKYISLEITSLYFFTKSKFAHRIQESSIIMKTEIISKDVKFVPKEWENQWGCYLEKN